MDGSQHYIGTKNGVVLCVDAWDGSRMKGRMYHAYRTAPATVRSIEQLFSLMESFFNELGFPHPEFDVRSFQRETRHYGRQERLPRQLTDAQLLEKRGSLCTLILRVQHRQNTNWQGRVTWVETDRTRWFDSEMELLRLLQIAMSSSQRDASAIE